MRKIAAFLLAICAGGLVCLTSANAGTVPVDIVNYAFSPDTVTINVDDTVQWNWQGNYHSTTSYDYLWDSGVYNQPFAFSYTFTSAGSYPYYCSIHFFAGTVNVQAPSVPPTVAITNPVPGVVLSAPATLTLSATATAADGTSPSVQFFQETSALGLVANAPYSQVVSNLPAGNYSFSAVATDDNGLLATNTISLSVVVPVAVTITAPKRGSSTSFQFSYPAAVGLRYAVDRATLLPNWTALSTNTAATPVVLFQDNNATAGASYYRVRPLPNP